MGYCLPFSPVPHWGRDLKKCTRSASVLISGGSSPHFCHEICVLIRKYSSMVFQRTVQSFYLCNALLAEISGFNSCFQNIP